MENHKRSIKAIPVFYTTVPNILIHGKFLNHVERELVILFASHLDGCTWSKISLRNYCECGPYHLERAIKRLQLWRMIKVIRGNWKNHPLGKRRENNRYIFEKNPYKWKLTPELQEKIIEQTQAMNMEPQAFEEKPFPNFTGFEIVFAKAYPKYAKGKKGRRSENVVEEEVEVENKEEKIITEVVAIGWNEKTERIINPDYPFFRLASDYFSYLTSIELARNTIDHDFSGSQTKYLLKLHDLYTNRMRNPRSDIENEIVNKILELENEKKGNIEISSALSKYIKERKI